MNWLLACFSAALGWWEVIEGARASLLIQLNLGLMLFNLLPALPLEITGGAFGAPGCALSWAGGSRRGKDPADAAARPGRISDASRPQSAAAKAFTFMVLLRFTAAYYTISAAMRLRCG